MFSENVLLNHRKEITRVSEENHKRKEIATLIAFQIMDIIKCSASVYQPWVN